MRYILKITAAALAAAVLLQTGSIRLTFAETGTPAGEGLAYVEQLASYAGRISYEQYLAAYTDESAGADEITLRGMDYARCEGMSVSETSAFTDKPGLVTGEDGSVEWDFFVKAAGMYSIEVTYYPIGGKSSSIQRAVLVDGGLPYEEMSNVEFPRFWKNEKAEIQRDNRGNDLRPRQIEAPALATSAIKDSLGYYKEPLKLYLSQGSHTLALVSLREPMLIVDLRIAAIDSPQTYDQVKQSFNDKANNAPKGFLHTIEAETADTKSSPMLYPITDNSSSAITPYSAKEIRMNTVGGYNWREAGQSISWVVDIPESGYYQIGLHVKQTFVRGTYSSRRLLIDGKVPFAEAEDIAFRYNKDWRVEVLGDNGERFLFYLEKGKRTLTLEVSLGEIASSIREVEESVQELNKIYRQVLMITGTLPDPYRDYHIEENCPGIQEKLAKERDRLKSVSKRLEEIAGKKSDREAVITTMTDQINALLKDTETITKQLTSFRLNIGGLGTWIMQAKEMPLQLDQVYVFTPGAQLPKPKNSFLDKLAHEFMTMVYSFWVDYNSIGNVPAGEEAESIQVWVGTGRDQANTIKSLIDESFTSQKGIGVNLMLVQITTLLQAIVAGQGPDAAIQVTNDMPMNYGTRHAVADISKFPDFQEVSQRFYKSAMVPFEFEGSCFALPETQTFNMMFYRKDVLQELGISLPQTWQDVNTILPVLDRNYLQFGLLPLPDLTYGMFLFQNGGQFYKDDGKASDLDSEVAIKAFEDWTKYYTDYVLEREYDFVNRFRTGEMPIGIADYTTYNTLQVSAPEIRGLWGFTLVPGVKQTDGSINRSVPSTGTSVIMMEDAKGKESSWEFMKWWTSKDIQVKYGREMEGLMGPSARYPTANIEALQILPWPVTDFKNILQQMEYAVGIPQVPGGYFTSRHINNALYQVIANTKLSPREALTDYVQYINSEITAKRKEFGLETYR